MANKIAAMISSRRRKLIFVIAIVLVVAGIVIGSYLSYQSSGHVTTDNARITAPLIPVTTLNACQIITLDVDLGSYVERGQRVADVGQPRPFDPTDRQGSKAIPVGRTGIEAPVSGFVAAIWTYPGAVVSPGQPILTISDSSNVWVMANIDETKLNRIRPGQAVEIKVDSLGGATLKGSVEGIAAATAATFSLLPQQNTTGNFIKVIQVVPVKIAIENPEHILLIPGTSVEVKIATR
jgi:multidrug resistance efflux pump